MLVIVTLLGAVMAVSLVMALVRLRGRTASAEPTVAETAAPAHADAASAEPARSGSADERLVAWLRARPGARKALSALSVLLLLGSAAMIGWPYFTNLYQERVVQSDLEGELASGELKEKYLDRSLGEGDALTRLQIPSLDVDVVVVEGVTASALRAGAGHYPFSPLPCEIGNVSIAGHRTTYGRPFHNVDLLSPGDLIVLDTPIGTCTYQVSQEPFVVAPTDLSVVENTPDEARLTLTTCHPKGSARQRLIVHATMISSEFYEA